MVYAPHETIPTREKVLDLFAAIRRHGRSPLLFIAPAAADNPEGTIEIVEPGLIFGYLDRHRNNTLPNYYPEWLKLCKTVWQIAERWQQEVPDMIGFGDPASAKPKSHRN